jgi:hypothetical protein
VKRRKDKPAGLSSNACLWLAGDDRCSIFFRGKSLDEPWRDSGKSMATKTRCIGKENGLCYAAADRRLAARMGGAAENWDIRRPPDRARDAARGARG